MSDESSSSSSTDSSDQEITSEDDRSDESKKKDRVVSTNDTKQAEHENNASKAHQPGKKLQAKWDEMFERLLEYKAEHGHCLVPNRYAKDPQLGSWGK